MSLAAIGESQGEQLVVDEPDPATTLTVRVDEDGRSELVLMGPRTQALYHFGRPGPRCIKMRIRHGRAKSLVNGPLHGIVDGLVPWNGGPGALDDPQAGWLRRLRGHDGMAVAPALIQQLGEVLKGRMATESDDDAARHDLVVRAAKILGGADAESIQNTAVRLNTSERHLRTVFADVVGMSPKRFSRIDRVRRVLRHIGEKDLAHLAVEAGYYDQSHMTAEFRRVMGVTPAAYLAGRLPAAATCGS